MTTGWPPGLLQDDSRKLSDWFASRIDAKYTVRKVCAEIERKRMSEIKCTRCGQGGHLPVECEVPVLPDDRVLKDTPEKVEVSAVNLKAMTWVAGELDKSIDFQMRAREAAELLRKAVTETQMLRAYLATANQAMQRKDALLRRALEAIYIGDMNSEVRKTVEEVKKELAK